MSERTVGSLSAHDLGRPARIEWDGWVHTGVITAANHEAPPHTRYSEVRSLVRIRNESGSSWVKVVPADTPIEVRGGSDE